jgi:cytochrome o ubiquinol oxidase subunit 2
MNPSGDIAIQQRDLILISTGLMLLIIVPVIWLTLHFAWKYRETNTEAEYLPDWHHSNKIEFWVWFAPVVIIIILGTITWIYTHRLDPYRPLDRIDANRPIAADVQPLTVQVVSLDWKWLFIYPEYGVASVNELAAPVDRPIKFEITSSAVMNSFFIPALAGQIYSMAGMKTQLHAVINKPGTYEGFSANYSGHGFSHMRFKFLGLPDDGFDKWVAAAKASNTDLSRENYLTLAKPSEREPVAHFASVDADLFDAIVNMCVDGKSACMKDIMHHDMNRRSGLGGVAKLDSIFDEAVCTTATADKYLSIVQATPDVRTEQ